MSLEATIPSLKIQHLLFFIYKEPLMNTRFRKQAIRNKEKNIM